MPLRLMPEPREMSWRRYWPLYAGSCEGDQHSHHEYDYRSFEYLGVQGALAGALGIGDHSSASADFIAAGTNGDKTTAFVADARARGNDLAAVLAGAGNLYVRTIEKDRDSRRGHNDEESTHLEAQGALAGALGVGDHSGASADFIAAGTNGDSTYAFAADARAQGDDLATVLAGAGSLYWNRYLQDCSSRHGYTYGSLNEIGVQGALAGALGVGHHSSASACFLGAETNGDITEAFAADARAQGNDMAAVLAGAGNLYAGVTELGSNSHDGYYDRYTLTNLAGQAALAGSLGVGHHSSASACFLGAETNGDITEAFAAHARAQGNDLATVLAGAGNLYWNNLVQESNSKQGYSYVNKGNFGVQGALAGALGKGDHSSASADFVRAETMGQFVFDPQHTFALAVDPRARGNDLATVLGAAGALTAAYDSTDSSKYLGAQGAFVGALGTGDHSRASADFIGAGTYGYIQSTAYACDLRAKGNSFAAVAGGAGAVEFEQSPTIDKFDYQGSAVGAYSKGPNSNAFACYIRADTSWDSSSALARHIGSGPNGKVFAGVAHPIVGGIVGTTAPAGTYDYAMAGVISNPTILYWGIS
jgi:hypothetical protein